MRQWHASPQHPRPQRRPSPWALSRTHAAAAGDGSVGTAGHLAMTFVLATGSWAALAGAGYLAWQALAPLLAP